jgi:predicted MarR family transcription regulator
MDRRLKTLPLELALTVLHSAFSRWTVHCMSAAGLPELTPLDVVVLHHVHHRGRGKRLSDICFVLNVEDKHVVNYSLKKLQGLGVVQSSRRAKEVAYATTESGHSLIERYREIRERCLIDMLAAERQLNDGKVGEQAPMLRTLSSVFDRAARAVSSL